MKPNKQIRVGVFPLGHENVELFIWPDMDGGEFYLCPDAESVGRIRIGLSPDWCQTVSWLVHEVIEYATCRKDVRFARSGKLNGDHGDYLFVFNHTDFGALCTAAALFLTPALPAVAAIHKKHQKRK